MWAVCGCVQAGAGPCRPWGRIYLQWMLLCADVCVGATGIAL